MTEHRKKRIVEILEACLDLDTRERGAFLETACAHDPELKQEVARLLALDEQMGDFLEVPEWSRSGEVAGAAHPEQVGPYRILEVLGEGGMGVVYAAEQQEPLRRRVALKLIKLGMDTREVVVRFKSELQALALMDHPNIARVYDAGVSEQGRPYFVMELVPGEPIVPFCDTRRLSMRKRLELFAQVCRAVQHAHQKAIIHRDIKPSNILVSDGDEGPIPKIIDFGIAKAVGQRLTERTVFTERGQMIGTPEYMSPEQAESMDADVDTRTDIYSLGVLLYELLVGALPFDPGTLRRAGYAELQRIIREVEPPRPSTRLTDVEADIASVAARRRTDARLLRRELKGDLDWITMKALEKDRARRYATASELGADVARYLRHEPVIATPPSAWYRMNKLARRHKAAVTATSLVLGALMAGFLVSLVMYFKAERARKAELERAQERDIALERAEQNAEIAETRIEEVLRLADGKRLANYEAEAKALWPCVPERVPDLEAWLAKAQRLSRGLVDHKATLEAVRRMAEPYDEAARAHDRQSHPEADALARLMETRRTLAEEARRRRAETGAAEGTATVISGGDESSARPPDWCFRHSFLFDGSPERTEIELRIVLDESATFYLNGKEVLAIDASGTTRKSGAGAPSGEEGARIGEAIVRIMPGDGLVAGENFLAVHVRPSAAGESDLLFSAEVMAGDRILVSAGAAWRYAHTTAKLGADWMQPEYDDSAWSSGHAPFGYGFKEGPGRLLEIEAAVAKLDLQIAETDQRTSERRTWSFEDEALQWEHDLLVELVSALETFTDPDPRRGAVSSVKERLEVAISIYKDTIEDHRDAWSEAVRSIADPEICPLYEGLPITPQVGLIPLGRDPVSKLWEFAHVETGKAPGRREDGKLEITEETGLVFVLLPGGTFRMGAEKPPRENMEAASNVDPQAEENEALVHDVRLAPFFISKYEMTQAQWLRVTGANPSYFGPESSAGDHKHSLLHPVESLTWVTVREEMFRFGLTMPTEAQWEDAARGGTSTPWWSGATKESLEGGANVLDAAFHRARPGAEPYETWLDDGYAAHAPVGTFAPNPFGLHDVAGNVWEWCQDAYGSYEAPLDPETGEHLALDTRFRVVRGGAWHLRTERCRSSARNWAAAGSGFPVGVRPARRLMP